jgi:hypothetical protein
VKQARIDEITAGELFARAYESGVPVEAAAETWVAAAARGGNYPEVCIPLSRDETGRYSVDPLEPRILAMARRNALNAP